MIEVPAWENLESAGLFTDVLVTIAAALIVASLAFFVRKTFLGARLLFARARVFFRSNSLWVSASLHERAVIELDAVRQKLKEHIDQSKIKESEMKETKARYQEKCKSELHYKREVEDFRERHIRSSCENTELHREIAKMHADGTKKIFDDAQLNLKLERESTTIEALREQIRVLTAALKSIMLASDGHFSVANDIEIDDSISIEQKVASFDKGCTNS